MLGNHKSVRVEHINVVFNAVIERIERETNKVKPEHIIKRESLLINMFH